MTSPSDWHEHQFGDLISFSNGINADKSAYGRGVPFINVLEVITNESLRVTDIPGRVTLPNKVLARYRVRRGDILFNRTSETQEEVGLASVYLDDSTVVFGGFVLRGIPTTPLLDVDYSKYALRASDVRKQIVARGQGGIRANVGQRDLRSVIVRVPDKPEQRAIAEVIDDVSALITTLKRRIAKSEAMRRGMMQQLLTGRTRLPGFTGPWDSTMLGELGIFLKGRGVRRGDVQSTGVPCIRYGELYTDFFNYTSTTRSFVSIDVAANALPIRNGDLLFAGSGETKEEIGMCVAYVGDKAVAGGDIIVLRGSSFNPIFLATLSNTPELANQKARSGQGDAVVHISSRALASVRLWLPLREEQDAIADVLIDSDREITALRRRQSKARAIKVGLMQQLLSGRVRLPVELSS